MKNFLICFLFSMIAAANTSAQNVAINNNGALADASAMLDIQSTTKGLLIPRMTAAQRTAISNPAPGLVLFQTDGSRGFYYNSGTAASPVWTYLSPVVNTGWSIAGNAGTNPAIHFIGTTDNRPLVFRLNNQYGGKFSADSGNYFIGRSAGFNNTGFRNIAVGDSALSNNTTGVSNIAIGKKALFINTNRSYILAIGDSALYNNGTNLVNPEHGTSNLAIGARSMFSNTNGYFNTAIAFETMYSNTTGFANTAVGQRALYANTTGAANNALGVLALYSNLTGDGNNAAGQAALSNNTSGFWNTALGHGSLFRNTSGSSNVSVGIFSLFNNTDRSNLVAIGDSALYSNGIGASSIEHATGNTAVGSKSLFLNTTGYLNTGTGTQSLSSNTTGFGNTGIGAGALYSNTTGMINNAVGVYALYSNTTGEGNIAMGQAALYSNLNGAGNVGLGYGSLFNNISGNSNIAIGSFALFRNRVHSNLVALGDSALYNNGLGTTDPFDAHSNTAVGSKALYSNTTGSQNTASGYGAMRSNINGTSNTAYGNLALRSNVSAHNNTAIGAAALINNLGQSNTAVGETSLGLNINGSYNTALGSQSMTTVPGDSNTAIGYNANCLVNGLNNTTAVGAWARVGISNALVLGDTSNVNVGIGTAFPAQARLVVNGRVGAVSAMFGSNTTGISIESNWPAIGFNNFYNGIRRYIAAGYAGSIWLNQSNGSMEMITYGNGAANAIMGAAKGIVFDYANNSFIPLANSAYTLGSPSNRWSAVWAVNGTIQTSDTRLKENIKDMGYGLAEVLGLKPVSFTWKEKMQSSNTQLGFEAQQVEKIIPEAIVQDKDVYGMNYSALIPVLVKGMQEQQDLIEKLQQLVEELGMRIRELEKR
jgi:trimeric autotransporter adhesin